MSTTEGDDTATSASHTHTADGSTTEDTGTATSTADTHEKTNEKDDDSLSSITESSDEGTSDTGLTENQNRLLYLLSIYTHVAQTEEDKEEWIRKPALMVLIYEAVVAQVLDYDYAPQSQLVEARRKYFNISQEGKSDVDFLREEELINGLKLSSKTYQPVTPVNDASTRMGALHYSHHEKNDLTTPTPKLAFVQVLSNIGERARFNPENIEG